MNRLVIVSTLFVLGSLAGYVLEVFYRRFFSAKKWINPGFLVGPYIPLYGFGVMLLYGLSNVDFLSFSLSGVGEHIVRVVCIGVSLTLIEFLTGIIFIRGLHIKLWDYSDRLGNVMGVICPLFSVIWFLLGCGYYFFLNGPLVGVIEWLGENPIYSYSVGLVIGMVLVDTCYSIRLGIRIRAAADQFVVRYEQFKIDVKREAVERAENSRFFGTLVAVYRAGDTLRDVIRHHVELLRQPKKWWKKEKK
ncbi:MAG: putative ABC transporter permease [Clostridia bacterium]|nr:putative ABC transporter permease [Clostridia bacterium]